MAAKPKMSYDEFLREMDDCLAKGTLRPTDPIFRKFKGSPPKAAALHTGEVMQSDSALAEDLSTMRFFG